MTKLLTAAQMRAIEETAIESGDVSGLELMERAGRGVVDAIFQKWPELAKTNGRAVVLSGPGNNGGDGFVIARLLRAWGWELDVFLYGDPEKLPPDARRNFDRWCEIGHWQELKNNFSGYAEDHPETLLAIDALFGTGLTRPVLEIPAVMQELNRWRSDLRKKSVPKIVCVDIPSGICADSGKFLTAEGKRQEVVASKGDLTVSFHSLKLGHVLSDGPASCGTVVTADIGLQSRSGTTASSGEHSQSKSPEMKLCEQIDAGHVQGLQKQQPGHKYAHGHALILCGGPGKTGAARLAARGALRIGAGLVTLGVPPSAQLEVASQISAIMLQDIDDQEDLSRQLEDPRYSALCLGPGLGIERARSLVPAALAVARATVLDADALSAYSQSPARLFELLHDNCVLTPHGGEFARLFPDIAEKLNAAAIKGPAYSKVDATREAAERAGCVILFKGQDTVIAAPGGKCSIHAASYDRAAPWLATAGSGDVLAGFITGLLARQFDPFQAAASAAWLHVECAREFGAGLIAEDLPEQLPAVLSRSKA
ncbi:MAG: NAD(P)H-hydrate dehydratase [Ruegeria sp.]